MSATVWSGPRRIALCGLVVAASAVIVGLVVGSGRHHGRPVVRTAPAGIVTSTTVSVDRAATELLDLLAKGNTASWHARYAATASAGSGASPTAGGATTVIEVWRRPPLVRQDITQMVGTTVVSAARAFVLTSGAVSCVQQAGTGPWLCTPAGGGQAAEATGIVDRLAAQLKGVTVTVRDDNLQGQAVRCFDATVAGQPIRTCLTPDGIPVLYITGTAQLQLQSLDRSVAESVFTPPAPVNPGGGG